MNAGEAAGGAERGPAADVGAAPGPASGFGLRPRPTVDPLVASLIAAAALDVCSRAPGADPAAEAAQAARTARVEQAERSWRFSGRWWTRPSVQLRGRPSPGRAWAR